MIKKPLDGGHYLPEHSDRRGERAWHEHPVIGYGDLDYMRGDRPGGWPVPRTDQQSRRPAPTAGSRRGCAWLPGGSRDTSQG